MDDDLCSGERALDGLRIADVPLEQLDVEPGQIVGRATSEVVETPDLVAAVEELGNEVGADKAAGASDEDSARNRALAGRRAGRLAQERGGGIVGVAVRVVGRLGLYAGDAPGRLAPQ